MEKKKNSEQATFKAPRVMLYIAGILWIIALILSQVVPTLSPEFLMSNVPIAGSPFILFFIGLVIAFIWFIIWFSAKMNGRIERKPYFLVEGIIIGGIVVGVLCMFQSFTIVLFQLGFLILLACMITFNVWSHVVPHSEEVNEEVKIEATAEPEPIKS